MYCWLIVLTSNCTSGQLANRTGKSGVTCAGKQHQWNDIKISYIDTAMLSGECLKISIRNKILTSINLCSQCKSYKCWQKNWSLKIKLTIKIRWSCDTAPAAFTSWCPFPSELLQCGQCIYIGRFLFNSEYASPPSSAVTYWGDCSPFLTLCGSERIWAGRKVSPSTPGWSNCCLLFLPDDSIGLLAFRPLFPFPVVAANLDAFGGNFCELCLLSASLFW